MQTITIKRVSNEGASSNLGCNGCCFLKGGNCECPSQLDCGQYSVFKIESITEE